MSPDKDVPKVRLEPGRTVLEERALACALSRMGLAIDADSRRLRPRSSARHAGSNLARLASSRTGRDLKVSDVLSHRRERGLSNVLGRLRGDPRKQACAAFERCDRAMGSAARVIDAATSQIARGADADVMIRPARDVLEAAGRALTEALDEPHIGFATPAILDALRGRYAELFNAVHRTSTIAGDDDVSRVVCAALEGNRRPYQAAREAIPRSVAEAAAALGEVSERVLDKRHLFHTATRRPSSIVRRPLTAGASAPTRSSSPRR